MDFFIYSFVQSPLADASILSYDDHFMLFLFSLFLTWTSVDVSVLLFYFFFLFESWSHMHWAKNNQRTQLSMLDIRKSFGCQ